MRHERNELTGAHRALFHFGVCGAQGSAHAGAFVGIVIAPALDRAPLHIAVAARTSTVRPKSPTRPQIRIRESAASHWAPVAPKRPRAKLETTHSQSAW